MSAGGDATLALAYSQVGMVEQPPYGNECDGYWAWWGCNLGSWCGCFVSWAAAHAGFPLPAIDGSCSGTATGFVSCPSGTVYAYNAGETVDPEAGDVLIFSWYPWEIIGGVPIITSGEYAGWVAGDHTGFFVNWEGGSYMRTVEGNTSMSSSDNGGAVMERTDRYSGQVCAYWRPAIFGSGQPAPPAKVDDDLYQTCLVTTEGHPWKGSVFMCGGGLAIGMNDPGVVGNLQARGLAGPTINCEAWDIYGGYIVRYPSGPGAIPV